MVIDDVALNKCRLIETKLQRIQEVYRSVSTNFAIDLTKQESILFNFQRCCVLTIDIAMHLVRSRNLGIPQSAREAFELLVTAKLLPAEIIDPLYKMVGFRNTIVHEYVKTDLKIVENILNHSLSDFVRFVDLVKRL